MFKLHIKHRYRKIFTISALFVVLAIAFLATNKIQINENLSVADKIRLEKLITEKMIECSKEVNTICYQKIAQHLANNYGMQDILSIFEQNENKSEFFEKCHTTLHFLGQEKYKIVKNTSTALTEGTPICFAGFYHGVLEAYLTESGLINDEEELAKILPTLCSKNDNFTIRKNYNECLHGLGHALMFATDGELPDSLKLCDTLSSESDRNWCYSGSFMENSNSSTNKDHPSKYLKQNDILYPCNVLATPYLNMCYTLQGFYFAELSKYDWLKTGTLCLQVPKDYIGACFNSIGQNQVGFTQDLEVMKQNCLLAPERFQESCIQGVAGALYERYNQPQEKMELFCNSLSATLKSICQKRMSNLLQQ